MQLLIKKNDFERMKDNNIDIVIDITALLNLEQFEIITGISNPTEEDIKNIHPIELKNGILAVKDMINQTILPKQPFPLFFDFNNEEQIECLGNKLKNKVDVIIFDYTVSKFIHSNRSRNLFINLYKILKLSGKLYIDYSTQPDIFYIDKDTFQVENYYELYDIHCFNRLCFVHINKLQFINRPIVFFPRKESEESQLMHDTQVIEHNIHMLRTIGFKTVEFKTGEYILHHQFSLPEVKYYELTK